MRVLPVILLESYTVLFELLDSFVRDKNPVISNFANVGYRLIFGIESCDRKILLARLVGFVCERHAHAMVLADSGIPANKSTQTDLTTSALMILSEINRKYPAEMKYNGHHVLVKNIFSKNRKFQIIIIHQKSLHVSVYLTIQVIFHWGNSVW